MKIVIRKSTAVIMTNINLSSSQFSSLPSRHSRLPSQGIAMMVISIVPGRRLSTHSMVASFGKVSLHSSKYSSSPYRQWKMPSHVFSEIIWIVEILIDQLVFRYVKWVDLLLHRFYSYYRRNRHSHHNFHLYLDNSV